MAAAAPKDVVIVGFGAAAAPFAVELARAGLSVVALERGPRHETQTHFARNLDTLQYRTRNAFVPPFADLPLTFRTDPGHPAAAASHNMASVVGGASITWSGYAWRYGEDDFRLKSALRERYGATRRLEYLEEDGAAIANLALTHGELERRTQTRGSACGTAGWPGGGRSGFGSHGAALARAPRRTSPLWPARRRTEPRPHRTQQ